MKRISTIALSVMAILTMSVGCMGKPKNIFSFSGNGGKTIECKGKEVSKKIAISDFHTIEAKGCVDIEYSAGPVKALLKAPEDAMDFINVSVNDGILEVSIVDDVSLNFKNIKQPKLCLTVSSSRLDKVDLLGACDFASGDLSASDIEFNLFGAGDVTAGVLKAESVILSTKGAGDMNIKGVEGENLIINTSGVGDITVKNINTVNVTASISGVGDITLSGKCETTDFTTSGVGDINARGLDAKSWNTKSSGVGKIKK